MTNINELKRQADKARAEYMTLSIGACEKLRYETSMVYLVALQKAKYAQLCVDVQALAVRGQILWWKLAVNQPEQVQKLLKRKPKSPIPYDQDLAEIQAWNEHILKGYAARMEYRLDLKQKYYAAKAYYDATNDLPEWRVNMVGLAYKLAELEFQYWQCRWEIEQLAAQGVQVHYSEMLWQDTWPQTQETSNIFGSYAPHLNQGQAVTPDFEGLDAWYDEQKQFLNQCK